MQDLWKIHNRSFAKMLGFIASNSKTLKGFYFGMKELYKLYAISVTKWYKVIRANV